MFKINTILAEKPVAYLTEECLKEIETNCTKNDKQGCIKATVSKECGGENNKCFKAAMNISKMEKSNNSLVVKVKCPKFYYFKEEIMENEMVHNNSMENDRETTTTITTLAASTTRFVCKKPHFFLKKTTTVVKFTD